ncbi:monocarboxylate transporter 13 [Nilaparvata lugens]|uniref:monocarboxylate transporter 13 n=1 Tax=Nilaparvata lugens TaxID=108931 RepID=UPI00193DB309|nr:monocarboxylate transporter 13 [Nilaparvata lugens]
MLWWGESERRRACLTLQLSASRRTDQLHSVSAASTASNHHVDSSMAHAPPPKHDEEDDAASEERIVPPDGGWGWVVVFASFMIHIITDGVTYTFGLFYLELTNYFNAGKGETALIVSILVGVTLCSGPISSALVNKYGCRPVTIAGAILGGTCMMVSRFANSISLLYITIGLGTGLGFGLIYLPAIVSVTCYFEKYRSLATGIAVCGSGLGTFVFAPIIKTLIIEFGWKDSMLIIGASILICILFGIMFRPLEPVRKTDVLLKGEEKSTEMVEMRAKTNGVAVPNLSTPTEKTNGEAQKRPHSIHLFLNSTPSAPPQANGFLAVPNSKTPDSRLALSQPHLLGTNEHYKKHWGSQMLRPTRSGIMYRKDILYHGSVTHLHHMDRNRSYSWTHLYKQNDKPDKSQRNSVVIAEEPQTGCCSGLPRESLDTVKEMLDFSLLKDPIFILFTLSNFCTSIGFYVPYIYIVAQAEEKKVDKNMASMILAVIGMANTVGRIVLGYLSDKTWINRLWVYNTSLAICGISTALSAFCNTFVQFSIYATVFGFTIGAYVGLTSVILVDLLGLDRLTNAFGLLLLFQGIASLVGPPIAGWLYDAMDSYDPGFYVAGVTIAFSGIMLYIIPWLQRYLHARKEQKRKSNPESPNSRVSS